jgi:hypothetical protein
MDVLSMADAPVSIDGPIAARIAHSLGKTASKSIASADRVAQFAVVVASSPPG